MGRPKQFNREGVLDRAIPVFWKHGFANTTLQHLEQATGVNKSGLYTEFKDKEDLFLASLERYAQTRGAEILTAQPLGWGNIERFLRLGFGCDDDQRGCFAVNSMRELAGLPAEAQEIISSSQQKLTRLLTKNIEAGCRTVIGSRLKQSGMFWTLRGANAIIALRCCHLNTRIETYWEARRAA